MKNIKDVFIIICVNIVLFSVFSIAADKENKLFTAAAEKHIQQYTDLKGDR